MNLERTYTDTELLFAATARCRCGLGLAYPLDHDEAWKIKAWVCAGVLHGMTYGEHDAYSWSEYKIREETSINNSAGTTTREPGTAARTVGYAACPECAYEWHSEPYNANGLGHHWFSGPCPNCGYAVGAEGRWSSDEGEPIRHLFHDVVVLTEDGDE